MKDLNAVIEHPNPYCEYGYWDIITVNDEYYRDQ